MNHPVKNRGVKVNKYSYFDGDSLWYPVKSVNRVSYKGKVYDIDMENDENPVVSFSLVRG
jgi:intein/homing endonuclease